MTPVGVFDSGVGGLSILQALRSELPHEDFVYIADSGHAPYGERDDSYVIARSRAITRHLRSQHAIKALVVACNTATAAAIDILRRHMSASNYAARIMEIAMHALMQSLAEAGVLGSATLIPLSQMRSANKKHGNIGDIELCENDKIIEAWDAKYGKSYLRDELEELHDKLEHHAAVTEAGFVTSETPVLAAELTERIAELQEINDLTIHILTLDEWVTRQYQRVLPIISMSEADLAQRWIRAYVESLAQKRRTQAPIDEPSFQWLTAFQSLLNIEINRMK